MSVFQLVLYGKQAIYNAQCTFLLNQETQEFKEIIKELFVLLGTFAIADYLPWLRPLDLGGLEKRMQQLRVRLDAICTEFIEEHEVKRRTGPVVKKDKSVIDVLLNEMHEQDNTESAAAVDPIDLDNLRSTIIVRKIDQDLQRS